MRQLITILGVVVALAAPTGANEAASGRRGTTDVSPLAARLARAAPGETVEVGPGEYRGLLRIEKPVRLVGIGRPVLDAGGRGDVVEIAAAGVELRGFVVRGTGTDLDSENVGIRVLAPRAIIEDNEIEDVLFGIDCKGAPGSVIRNNRIGGKDLDIARRGDAIRLWRSDDTLIEGNVMRDGRDAILWYSSGVTVRGNTCQRCRYGFHLMYSNRVTLEGNTLTDNSVGVYFMYSSGVCLVGNTIVANRGPSGYGIGLKDTDAFVIEDNLIAENRVGVYLDTSPVLPSSGSRIAHNTIAMNDAGMSFLPSVKGNTISENSFIENFEQVAILGRGELSNNDFELEGRGNYWSDYAGYDRDGDGIGESSYDARKLFERLSDKEPRLKLFRFSPAQDAIEFVARAIPAVQPEPKFSDDWPLVGPAGARVRPARRAASGGFWILGGVLVATSASMIAGAYLSGRRARGTCPRQGGGA